ncbi:MAG: 50S ribosomal protein L20 [Candidatus Yonathbacteria bacterium CG10_big_fil_rev_8_21_14_0_10_43_136]|uniref:Large ribosomal subunit protein bL20 n=2 Tax=Parcubacteria group TaxID=1794811 RepID=A0A2M7Q674_9BACT|nr:MAG: 50S ribosomal protein L20 [Candidatus Nomurabacteria bacterium CG2_30_43_9]PIQ35660.1 MAG: 50S ribosomal protein L20 [Candidatus Yonathbacteria bacterium CG17_big_fil_post_rev_8_21_14_2_50_43_9]PIR40471.1 MAG: 50S ribosomal protein L20 [Candidatus Yonathbacteria bacterium CG10_big_fil_rev_8_21_14_0_10_43_136]PIX57040.1 MAG: 50S ribosomal protein L20 [Candidatus Yonathbacteria bacterium CG_4_10_14_3_um_filter_43_12]PIY58689.1 MAG: 50S ribosomal protein L20 [Candidatus Yonathbacteria bact
MTRVKRGTTSAKRRRNVLAQVKGYRFGRSTKEIQANDAIAHAGAYAFAHRRDKKNVFRRLWTVKMNAALRPLGFSYSKFIAAIKKKNIIIDRKIMADLAENNPDTFVNLVNEVK